MLGRALRLIQGGVQVPELAGYISYGGQEPERAPHVQSIRQKLVVEAPSVVFEDVKGLGEGTDRGLCQSFLP